MSCIPYRRSLTYILLSTFLLTCSGCWHREKAFQFSHDGDLAYYQATATEIEYPAEPCGDESDPLTSNRPRVLENPQEAEPWELRLEECIQIALANSQVIRSLGASVLQNPDSRQTTLDPALVETSPRFGVEAALSEFDANLEVISSWERRDRPVNQFAAGLFPAVQKLEGAAFSADLSKTAATGTRFAARHHVTYDANNNPTQLFDSAWDVDYELEARQPFLQGAGIEFNRINGPNSGIGSPNGVLLARIRTDVSLADFERGVRNFVSDVENAYWELYFAYRDLDAKIAARDEALETWRDVANFVDVGDRRGRLQDEAQARSQYYAFQAAVESALTGTRGTGTITGDTAGSFAGQGGVYGREANLRFLMGLAPNDGRLIIPTNQPMTAQVLFDWHALVHEANARRVELRRQKWVIKQRELELIAARNFLLPRLDGIALYRWRGLGDDLIHPSRQSGIFPNAYQTLTGGDFQEWTLGFQLDVPIGYRREAAAVRNAELSVAREQAILHNQELELLHQLDAAVRQVELAYQLIQTNYNRLDATIDDLKAWNILKEGQAKISVDEILRAQQRNVEAEIDYHNAVITYNLAIKNLHFQKGSLLQYNGIVLAEGPWTEEAHLDAMARSQYFSPRHMNYRLARPGLISNGPYSQQQLRDDLTFDQEGENGANRAEAVPLPPAPELPMQQQPVPVPPQPPPVPPQPPPVPLP